MHCAQGQNISPLPDFFVYLFLPYLSHLNVSDHQSNLNMSEYSVGTKTNQTYLTLLQSLIDSD